MTGQPTRSNPRRIMHVLEPAAYGGSEAVVSALTRGASGRGDRVHVVMPRQNARTPTPLSKLAELPRVEVTEVHCGRRHYLREVREITRLIRAWQPDVVHTHVYHSDIVGYFAARRADAAVVSTVHGMYGGSLAVRFYEWLDLRVQRRMDAVICVSQTLADRALSAGVEPSRVHVVRNGRDDAPALSPAAARAALGIDPGARIVGWIGRFSHEKGPDVFVEAMRELRGVARGIMIGDGPLRSDVERAILASGADVVLLGTVPQAGKYVRAFDALAISSRSEGLPITALDAMASQVPLVTTRVGGLPDLLAGEAGWLVDGPAPQALAQAIRQALDDTAGARARALRARDRFSNDYSIAPWLEKVDAVYDEAIARRGATRRAAGFSV